jgi:hypothetical protein
LAGAVWLYGTYLAPRGGLDGPCFGASDFSLGAGEGSSLRSEWSWLPPGERCVEERPSETEREQTYPAGDVRCRRDGVCAGAPRSSAGRHERAESGGSEREARLEGQLVCPAVRWSECGRRPNLGAPGGRRRSWFPSAPSSDE